MNKEYIERLLEKDIQSFGCYIWGIELSGSSSNPVLRLFIDKKKGINLDDCEKISKHVSRVLEADKESFNNFSLEVSSPGIERKFFSEEQYSDYLGFLIKVRYRKEDNQFNTIKGYLQEVVKDGLVIKVKNKEQLIGFQDIERSNLDYSGV
tara:strand:- start:1770 stop:2222 length:453 start_codon:yes stop_codon:yes gene_type:complete